MAPKTNCNPLKLATMTAWFQKSRVAHNIKDLEKMLPSVGSISGMQVKDYLQALQDENKINVEKIGSGNWYWSFISQDKKTRQVALAEAQAAHDKQAGMNADLGAKVAEAKAHRADEEDMLDSGSDSREELMGQRTQLEMEVNFLKKELAAYSDSDPTELERKKKEMIVLKGQADQFTDEILSMEGWFKDVVQIDGEQMLAMKMEWYGNEFDEEESGLRELV